MTDTDTVVDALLDSKVCVVTPEPVVQPASAPNAQVSATSNTAEDRLGMKAPSDATGTVSDLGRPERGQFSTEGHTVNLIFGGALKIQASEQGTTTDGSDPAIARPRRGQ